MSLVIKHQGACWVLMHSRTEMIHTSLDKTGRKFGKRLPGWVI